MGSHRVGHDCSDLAAAAAAATSHSVKVNDKVGLSLLIFNHFIQISCEINIFPCGYCCILFLKLFFIF